MTIINKFVLKTDFGIFEYMYLYMDNELIFFFCLISLVFGMEL